MDSSRLFRKVALERMSSPEQLDQLLQVTAPRNWLALAALMGLLVAAIGWGFVGRISTTISGQGVLVPGSGGRVQAIVFIPVAEANVVRTNMEARVSPAMVRREEAGFVRAHVAAVSAEPSSQAALVRSVSDPATVAALEAAGPVVEILVELEPAPGTPSGYHWSSSGQVAPARLSAGTSCAVDIVIRTERPIGLVFPYFRQTPGSI
jgi:hypothetical protein